MNKTCGNCAFASSAREIQTKIYCVFGGIRRGPFRRSTSGCVTHALKPSIYATTKDELKESKASKANANKQKDEKIFTDEELKELKYMYDTGSSFSDMCKHFAVRRIDLIKIVSDNGWKRKLSYASSKPDELKVRSVQDKGIRTCKGYCCKYKLYCQRYQKWKDLGKPDFGNISSVSSCINGTGEKFGQQHFYNFIPIEGTDVGSITFAETCD